MQQFKRAQVIMLPTENKSKYNDIILNPNTKLLLQFKHQNCTEVSQHLYIISDDKIKEGDWCLNHNSENQLLILKFEKLKYTKFDNKYWKKIIATTDNNIDTKEITSFGRQYPKPSQQFIEKYIECYNKGEIITDVLVEYEFIDCEGKLVHPLRVQDGCGRKIKINHKDNTITIKKVKDNYNRKEVIELIKRFNSEAAGNAWFDTDENWIEENL